MTVDTAAAYVRWQRSKKNKTIGKILVSNGKRSKTIGKKNPPGGGVREGWGETCRETCVIYLNGRKKKGPARLYM